MANLTATCDMLGVSSTDINACSPSMSTFGIVACIAKSYFSYICMRLCAILPPAQADSIPQE
jgi:hypothetical protein